MVNNSIPNLTQEVFCALNEHAHAVQFIHLPLNSHFHSLLSLFRKAQNSYTHSKKGQHTEQLFSNVARVYFARRCQKIPCRLRANTVWTWHWAWAAKHWWDAGLISCVHTASGSESKVSEYCNIQHRYSQCKSLYVSTQNRSKTESNSPSHSYV